MELDILHGHKCFKNHTIIIKFKEILALMRLIFTIDTCLEYHEELDYHEMIFSGDIHIHFQSE